MPCGLSWAWRCWPCRRCCPGPWPNLRGSSGGHISPLAACNAGTDRVLIPDVARYRYTSVWVPLADLWQAICTSDTSSGRSRGVGVVRRSRGRFSDPVTHKPCGC